MGAPVRRVFKTRTFARWSRKASLPDASLCKAVAEMSAGLIDADLGGGVYKKRVPMPGRGKSGGARTILGSNLGDRWFSCSASRRTIDARELAALQKLTEALLSMGSTVLERSVTAGELTEICHEKKPPAK
jgi:hypothetical protein